MQASPRHDHNVSWKDPAIPGTCLPKRCHPTVLAVVQPHTCSQQVERPPISPEVASKMALDTIGTPAPTTISPRTCPGLPAMAHTSGVAFRIIAVTAIVRRRLSAFGVATARL